MKKIKSVTTKLTIVKRNSDEFLKVLSDTKGKSSVDSKWQFVAVQQDRALYLTQNEMESNLDIFDITYESEYFEMEVPSERELADGYVLECNGDIVKTSSATLCSLINAYNQGNWSATKEPLEKLKKYRDAIQYCNALWKRCEAENEKDELNTGIWNLWLDSFGKFTIGYNHNSGVICHKFSSRQSAEQFLKQCSPDMLETLKEMYGRKELV